MLVFVLRCNSLLALTYCVWGLYVLEEEKKIMKYIIYLRHRMCFSTCFSPKRKSLKDVYKLGLIYLQRKHASRGNFDSESCY